MNLEYIKTHWINKQNTDLAASISAWDIVAEDYVYDGTVTMETDNFLKFLQSKIQLNKSMHVLDVGCGAGAYSVALASSVQSVVGVDFSPKMIAAANRSKQQLGITNTEFLERDWYGCSSEEFRGQYDIVFAHTTPAVVDYDTFMKLMEASRRYCLICKPARRTDEVFDQLRSLIGLRRIMHDESIAYTFDTIWEHGYNPEISYDKTIWQSSKPLEEAKVWYLGRLKGFCQLTKAQEDAVCRHLEEISVNGKVAETTHTTLVNLFWEVN